MFDQAVNINLKKSDKFECEVIGEQLRFSIRMHQSTLKKASNVFGFNFPKNIGGVEKIDKTLCMCLGPDEWIVISEPELKPQFDDIFSRLSGYLTISITDISNRNIGFILRGSEVQKYINSGCPLDLDLKSFPVGESSRTVFESVSILLFRESETSFRVECWRSFSSYLTNFFERIAKTND